MEAVSPGRAEFDKEGGCPLKAPEAAHQPGISRQHTAGIRASVHYLLVGNKVSNPTLRQSPCLEEQWQHHAARGIAPDLSPCGVQRTNIQLLQEDNHAAIP